jgi:hypothetical protein
MAFIAGMAVMLAILLPFLGPEQAPSRTVMAAHGGLLAVSNNCMQCHASIPKAPGNLR